MTHLSPREREVLEIVGQGVAYKTAAKRLGMSVHTVVTHVRRIVQKSGISCPPKHAMIVLYHRELVVPIGDTGSSDPTDSDF